MYSILFILGLLSLKNITTNGNNIDLDDNLPYTMPLDSISPKPKIKVKEQKTDSLVLTSVEQIELLTQLVSDIAVKEKNINLASAKCQMAFDRIDEFTGRQKRGLASRLFFTFTPESYRKFLKTKELITCEGYLTEATGHLMALHLTLTIAIKDASSKFGNIPAGSFLVLKGLQGRTFSLQTYAGAKPTISANETVYQLSYAIPKGSINALKKIEIDKVRMAFEKGTFSYDVYYLDFLKDQFPCF